MGSKSTWLAGKLGGLDGRSLETGDVLLGWPDAPSNLDIAARLKFPLFERSGAIRTLPGPQLSAFTPEAVTKFLSAEYEITLQSNRMGYRLNGPPLAHTSASAADILSEAVSFGAIQVPAGGQPIVLMADRPTTGGYPKIATVISHDLPRLAQMAPGARIKFEFVDLQQAQTLSWEELFAMYEPAPFLGNAAVLGI
jgi:antagonist of KipI